MAFLDIVTFPDPRLRVKAHPVTLFNAKLEQLTKDMLETMYHANGIGLAAIQVNIPLRIVVIDLSEKRNQHQVFINPEVEVLSENQYMYKEGCLSVPGFFEEISRPEKVNVMYQDIHGTSHTIVADSLLATCIQHEIDHLNGKLFVDYISATKRQRIRQQMLKKS